MLHEVHVWDLVFDNKQNIVTWRLKDANKLALKAWNKDLEDILGKTTNDIFQSNATEKFMPIVQKIFAENQPYTWEAYFESTDQYLQMTSIPCDGYFISTGIDISPQKRIEVDLRETVLKLTEAISSGNVGLWDWDIVDDRVFFSAEWKRQLGYADNEIANYFIEWQQRVHPDDIEKTMDFINASLSSDVSVYETEFRMRHKDGSYRWILAHATITRDNQNIPLRMVGSHLDITERKRLEDTILQQQKMQALGTLAGGIAHDFNNLLTPMLGFTQLAKMSIRDELTLTGYLNKIEDSAKRAKKLVQKILLMSRKSIENIETVYLDKMITEVLDLLKMSLPKNITISTRLYNNPLPIAADPSQIYQVILNLCTNAIQAMQNGGELLIQLSLLTKNQNNDHDSSGKLWLCLTIKDTGTGMSEATQKRIFEPFFTTKTQGEERGTGLGLSIVSAVIKQHQGEITVESEVDVGTEFTVYFPAMTEHAVTQKTELSLIKETSNKTVLLIDDEPSLCEISETVLKQLGYQVFTFLDGHLAIDYFIKHRNEIDIIVTDYSMPAITGPEVIAKIRGFDTQIPIILLTGFSNLATEENRVLWGCTSILSKPYNIEKFSQIIDQSIKK
jgi:PAS domain S-box-containing protein